jgi:hypothetical protein
VRGWREIDGSGSSGTYDPQREARILRVSCATPTSLHPPPPPSLFSPLPLQLVRGQPEPGACLRYLGVRGCSSITSSSITCVARSCKGLEEVDGGRVDLLTSPAMSSLATHCRDVKDMWVAHLPSFLHVAPCHGDSGSGSHPMFHCFRVFSSLQSPALLWTGG